MSAYSFRHRAIAFLRDCMDLHCVFMPQNRIEDEHGNARFEGALIDTRVSSPLNLASLYSLTLAATLAMCNERPMAADLHEWLRIGALAGLVLGVVGLVLAGVLRRRGTTRLHIELRGDAVVDIAGVETACERSRGRAVWIVAEHGFSAEAVAAAASKSVRCFANRGGSFTECASETAVRDLAVAA